jgi:predicted dehydrogenase
MFDVMIGLFGLPRSVSAQCASLVRRWDVEDCAAINMRLQNGASAQSRLNWNSKTWQHEFSILGTEARIDWSPYDSGPVIKTVGRNVEQLQLPSVENVHLPLVEDFVDSILANRSPLFPLMEALKTNTLIDAIYQSAHSGVEVKIN